MQIEATKLMKTNDLKNGVWFEATMFMKTNKLSQKSHQVYENKTVILCDLPSELKRWSRWRRRSPESPRR